MKTKIMRKYQKPVVQRLDGAISPTFSILFVVMYLGFFSKHLTVPLGLKLEQSRRQHKRHLEMLFLTSAIIWLVQYVLLKYFVIEISN